MPQFRLLIVALICATSAVAQTTWTSFEDRRGHTIAASSDGGVLMFGGESVEQPGKLLGDTNSLQSGNDTWNKVAASNAPKARTEHAMSAGLLGLDPVFIVFGGAREGATPGVTVASNETFCYEGGGWGKVDPPLGTSVPAARTGHAMVTDVINNDIYLFGGFGGGFPRNDLWRYEPSTETWTEIIPIFMPGSPQPRFDHCMAYFPLTQSIYLFGGSGYLNDTWQYSILTQTWTQLTPTTSPGGRRKSSMSYHGAASNVVLFGGQDSGLNALQDTWTLNPFTGDWQQESPTMPAPQRYDHALSGDQFGNEVVMLGGTDGTPQVLNSTWLWDGVNWVEELEPPSSRTGVAMTYDSVRNRHPVFGGRTIPGGTDLDETWELDGLNWRLLAPATSPSARSDAGIVYDSARQRTVLYGGRVGGPCGTELGDTWEWDGSGWSPRVLTNNPPAAGGVQPVFDSARNVTWMLVGSDMWSYDGNNWSKENLMQSRIAFAGTYDSDRNRLVVFGGATTSGRLNDTWEWDGLLWAQITPLTVPPSARASSTMVYHETLQTCLMVGGDNGGASGVTKLGDAWAWDGSSWTVFHPNLTPRSHLASVYDRGRDRSIVFGGLNWNWSPINTQWERDLTNEYLVTSGLASVRGAHSMAYEPLRDRTVVFGGTLAWTGGLLGDTWEYNGTSWSAQSPSLAPSARQYASMAFDVHSGTVLLFGGDNNGTYYGDTWSWDGSAWSLLTPTQSPTARSGGLLFSTGTRTLLFAGFNTTSSFSDIWEWDGTTWTPVDSGSPSPRTNYGSGYDSRRDRVVVFGGRDSCGSGNYLNETWEWDGDSWLQLFPANSPSPRERCQLTYDESRSRIVLFGGTDGSNTFADTWEWDGGNWIARLPTQSPPGSSGHGLTYDQDRNLTIAFGSLGTWDYGAENPGTIESTPTSLLCVGSNGAPTITPTNWSGPWLGESVGVTFQNAPLLTIGVMIFGLDNQFHSGLPLPLPLFALGSPLCELNISADILEILFPLPDPYVSAPFPNNPLLLGATIYTQAGFFDFGTPGNPVITSNSLALTLGAK